MSETDASLSDDRSQRMSPAGDAELSDIPAVIEDIRNGHPVIIVDDEDRENEGDLVIAAQMATPENINFMAKYGRGLICLPIEESMADRLDLQLVGRRDNTHHRTAFTVSIEAKEGITTGISAADRAKTIQTAINPQSGPQDIATPGHVFPLRAREGGVLVRAGHTEAATDLARMAGFGGAGVICEIMNDDGTMARMPDLAEFAKIHGLKIATIADLIAYRRRTERLVECIAGDTSMESRHGGEFDVRIYASRPEYAEHVVLTKGDVHNTHTAPLVRMHAMNTLKDTLGFGASDLENAMRIISREGTGVIVLIRSPDQHVLSAQLESAQTPYAERAQDDRNSQGPDSTAHLREYGVGAQILLDLGITRMTLLTNTPKNVVGLEGYGLEISGYHPLQKPD